MPNSPSQDSRNRGAYIPPQIAQAVDRHMQQSMPAHLQKYVGTDRPTYIPEAVQNQISQQMQKTMPAHLKSYADAYVQQRIVQPSASQPSQAYKTPVNTPQPFAPNPLRRDHSMQFGEQHSVELNSLPVASQSLFESASGRPVTPQALTAAEPQTVGSKTSGYDFIMSPGTAAKKPRTLPTLPGLSPRLGRVVIVIVGLIILLVVFNAIKSGLKGPSNLPVLLAVVQDQEELVHVATIDSVEPDISGSNTNYVSTAKLALTSSSKSFLTYLVKNGNKVKPAQLDLKIKLSTDSDLTTAESAGTFNQDFTQTNTTLLNGYLSDINTAYNATKGPNGRALLSSDYKQAKLLLIQLNPS